MKKIQFLSVIFLLFSVALSACNTATLQPTLTAVPSATPLPTSTFTPVPTNTPTLVLGEAEKVEAGGFSFQTTNGFQAQSREAQTTISNKDGTILISMASASSRTDTQSLQETLDGFAGNIAQDIENFKPGDPYSVTIDDNEGLAVDVTGNLFGDDITGKVMVVSMEKSHFFFAFGFAVNGNDGTRWQTEGSQVFDAVLGSVTFFEPVSNTGSGQCTISTDSTYGYSEENPIKVGGDSFDGPSRERAYLDNLLGPNGEKITYERTGSLSFEDTILDAFEITGLDQKVILYIDEYSYAEPQAPVGFTCLAAFPLTAP